MGNYRGLSADPSNTVLVIEAGTPDNYEAAVMIPRFYPGASGFAPGTRYDWNLTSVPQTSLQASPENAATYGMTYDLACHGRPNLSIVTGHRVTKLLFDTGGETPKAVAVEGELYYSKRKGRWTDTIAEALAFIPLSNFTTSDTANRLLSTINSTAAQFLPPGTNETVASGYQKQVEQILKMHNDASTADMELLYVDGGRSVVNILMHPLSRGTVTINSSDPFLPPVIDPRYFSHPYDGQLLVESLRFNRRLLATGPIQALGAVETLPGAATQSDEAIMAFTQGVTSTEYHYSGTCAMLPRALGGVVDSELKVHGVDSLRVVDASIMPLVPSAHTQATVYAIAEKAADLILGKQ
ncbi:hypothetical protein LZ31DRAFT_537896 [Colletotrichum somersetense]|nr:hypothetical protein LZ31DRAFT_537896 [Colletotrichum somersetense]